MTSSRHVKARETQGWVNLFTCERAREGCVTTVANVTARGRPGADAGPGDGEQSHQSRGLETATINQ